MKGAEAWAISDQKAQTVAEAFVAYFVNIFVTPMLIDWVNKTIFTLISAYIAKNEH